MATKKKPVISVVGDEKNDKVILDFLRFNYEIEDIIDIKDYTLSVDESLETGNRLEKEANFIIFNKVEDKKQQEIIATLYSLIIEGYFRPTSKLIGFGDGALALAALNGATILQNITNHNNVSHLTSFCMLDDRLLDFEVRSNHEHMILPSPRTTYDVLAFSTHNLSNSYTDVSKNHTFKAERNFLEIEGIKFTRTKSYCFLYEVPIKGESVLIDLTSQFLNR